MSADAKTSPRQHACNKLLSSNTSGFNNSTAILTMIPLHFSLAKHNVYIRRKTKDVVLHFEVLLDLCSAMIFQINNNILNPSRTNFPFLRRRQPMSDLFVLLHLTLTKPTLSQNRPEGGVGGQGPDWAQNITFV